jgi:hypothetical protein
MREGKGKEGREKTGRIQHKMPMNSKSVTPTTRSPIWKPMGAANSNKFAFF